MCDSSSVQPPPIIGNYELLEPIASGGMAEVFRARTVGIEGFERPIAIKRMRKGIATDQEYVEMFINEARLASQLTHENILQVYELSKSDGQLHIAMEFVEGRDLRQIVQKLGKANRTLPIPAAVHIAIKLCHALDYAHRKTSLTGQPLNLIHRDVSPQNVLVSYDGLVKLLDFGVAKSNLACSETEAGIIKGKSGYMAPEQIRSERIDHRVDIFSIGVTLYEMLTGTRLFAGENDLQILEKVLMGQLQRPRKVNPDIPAELEAIVVKALRRNRNRRYDWASQMAEDLQAFLINSKQAFSPQLLSSFMRYEFSTEISNSSPSLPAASILGGKTRNLAKKSSPAPKAGRNIDREIRRRISQIKLKRTQLKKQARKRLMRFAASTAALSAAVFLMLSITVQSQKLETLSITTNPLANIQIIVDGKPLGTQSPLLTSDLAPGFHILTVRSRNYRTQTIVFEHFPDKANSIHVDLVPEAIAQLQSP